MRLRMPARMGPTRYDISGRCARDGSGMKRYVEPYLTSAFCASGLAACKVRLRWRRGTVAGWVAVV